MLNVIYIWALGAVVGIELAIGVLVAPVIFFPASILGEGVLSHYQSGLLMTDIFLRYNMILLIVSVGSVIYELYMYRKKIGDVWAWGMSVVALAGMGLFVFYYTPFILEAQSVGVEATRSAAFASMHKGSEWAVKVILIAQSVLMGRRVWLMQKS
jgi:hypothetical protein